MKRAFLAVNKTEFANSTYEQNYASLFSLSPSRGIRPLKINFAWMKNICLIILVLCFFVSCKKDNNDNLIVNPIVNATYTFDNKNLLTVYVGDTIKYNFNFKSSRTIKYIIVSCIKDGGDKQELDLSDYRIEPLIINKTEDSVDFNYPIYLNYSPSWSFTEDNYSCKMSLLVDYYDTTGIVQTDTLPQFIYSLPNVENHQRLYNIASKDGHARGFSFMEGFVGYDFMPTVNCGGPCDRIDDEKLFMVNIPNSDFNINNDSAVTKDFISGWHAPKGNHFFVKVTNDYKYYNDYVALTPSFYLTIGKNHLIEIYDQNEPKTSRVENPKVGDLYAYRYVYPKSYNKGDVYGLIEVTHIEDDHLTSLNGGNELDYIEFRTKYIYTPIKINKATRQ